MKKKTSVGWAVLITVGIFTAINACVGLELRIPELGVDESWEQALVEATDHGRVFGKELVFSYGPLHQLATQQISSNLTPLIIGRILIGTCWLSTSILLGIRSSNLSALTFSLLVALLNSRTTWVQGRSDVLLILLATTGVLLSTITPSPRKIEIALLTSIASGILLSTLVKLSLVGIAIPSIACITTMTLVHGLNRSKIQAFRNTALIVIIPIAILILTWLSIKAGSIEDLWPYFAGRNFSIVQGYSDAMSSTPQKTREILDISLYLVGCAYISGYCWKNVIKPSAEKIKKRFILQKIAKVAPSVTLFIIAWVVAKSSFTRHDIHGITAGLSLFSISVVIGLINQSRNIKTEGNGKSKESLAISAITGFTISVTHHWQPFNEHATLASLKKLPQTLSMLYTSEGRRSLKGIRSREISKIRLYSDNYLIENASITTADTIPISITDLLAQNLIYTPRPIPQSYSSYKKDLQEYNSLHFNAKINKASPQIVAVQLTDIDDRLPSGLDGYSIRSILANYKYSHRGTHGNLIFLKCFAESTNCGRPELERNSSTGELKWQKNQNRTWTSSKIIIQNPYKESWIDLRFSQSIARRLVNFFWKASPVYLEYLDQNGKVIESKRIIPEAAHSLLVYPLPLDNNMLARIAGKENISKILAGKKFQSLRISSNDFWMPFNQTVFILDEVKR